MEVYRAVADFEPPRGDESHKNILSFSKGEQFEVVDNKKADWWGARRLKDNTVGYVPATYLQHEERRIGKLLPDNYHEHRDIQVKKFAAMQNSDEHKHPEELYSEVPEPDPDYQDEDSSDFPPPPPESLAPPSAGDAPGSPISPTGAPTIIGVRNGSVSSPEDEGDQVQPRKLVNPCLASRERQALHKELLMNYKLGKDVLQKPELNKVLAKRKETQKRKEWEDSKTNKRTSLELKLEERANKMKEKEDMQTISEDSKQPEFMKMHRRITTKTPTSPPT
ncbi:uncharacterized protein [Littorina saxatilis]|uniref:SH3 domain-containing protein n=1 Tax=Littorina saxatilis TaxID=31220 RepID=A0AAN9BCW7_9CAEN